MKLFGLGGACRRPLSPPSGEKVNIYHFRRLHEVVELFGLGGACRRPLSPRWGGGQVNLNRFRTHHHFFSFVGSSRFFD